MSQFKVGIRIRPVIESEIKLQQEEERISTDNDSLRCNYFLQSCNYEFDHVFDTTCDNGKVYSSIVGPVVESCFNGDNGTILTYGATSTGKNYTLMGTENDPGIVMYAADQLFRNINKTNDVRPRKIRVAFIEITTKEKVYNLLNDRKRIVIDPKLSIDRMLSDEEVPVENIGKMAELFANGHYQRKTSRKYKSKSSHSILRITIQSEDKADGTIRKGCLEFVNLANVGTQTDSLQVPPDDDVDKGLVWLNFVISELNQGKRDINFLNSTLTTILQEPLTSSDVAFICHIKANAVDETMATLKFASQVKSVRTTPVQNQIYADQASSPPDCDVSSLKASADVKVENLLLRQELDEMKVASAAKNKWFEDQMKAAEFEKQKLEAARMDERKISGQKLQEFELKIKSVSVSNRELWTMVEVLRKSDKDKSETVKRLKKENSKLVDENRRSMEVKRKIERIEDDLTEIKKMKSDFNCKREDREVEPSTSAERFASKKLDLKNESDTIDVPHQLVGCIIGVGGSIIQLIQDSSGAFVTVSDNISHSRRRVRVCGTAASVDKALGMIKQRIKLEKERQEKCSRRTEKR